MNALTGQPWEERLQSQPQNYLVCPDQPWLDGIHVGEGRVRQFVAAPLGSGYTIEGQLTGVEELGGMQLAVYDPVPGRFPDQPPKRSRVLSLASPIQESAMGISAGGLMSQKIYPDRYGIDAWDQDTRAVIYIHLINSIRLRELTGIDPPGTPIDAETYSKYGLPWFDLYDEDRQDIDVSEKLAGVKTIRQIESERGSIPEPDKSISLPPGQVKKLRPSKGQEETS
jgi:hypothetical protein